MDPRITIETGKAILGIEFGSTRIKAVLVDEEHKPIAQGAHEWENQLVDGLWTYSKEAIWFGLQDCYASLRADVKARYDVEIEHLAAIGISAMMHGYMPFDKAGSLLVPFRTWRNTNTGPAAAELSKLFVYNIPLRWSISHLYQAILNKEEHVPQIAFFTTLAGYIHWKLTGEKVLGVGDASGMLPIDPTTGNYRADMVEKFEKLVGRPERDRRQAAGHLWPPQGRDSPVPAGRRCRDRHGGDECRQAADGQRVRRHLLLLDDRPGARAFQAERDDRHGHHTGRKPRRDGALQQLHV